MNMRMIKRIYLIKLLLLAKRKLLFMVLICVATCFFAMQISISPMIAMLDEVSSTNMTDSFCLEFPNDNISETSKNRLHHMFDNSESVMDLRLDSGFYCSTYPDRSTLIGMKNGSDNKWYVQAEGRYFSPDEISEGRNVAIIPWRNYEWNDFSLESHDFEHGLSSYRIVGLGEFSSASQFFIGKQQIYQRISQEDDLQEL